MTMNIGLCETCKLWLGQAIKERLQQLPLKERYVPKNVHGIKEEISRTDAGLRLQDVSDRSSSCWLCYRLWRSLLRCPSKPRPDRLPETLNLRMRFDFMPLSFRGGEDVHLVAIGPQRFERGYYANCPGCFAMAETQQAPDGFELTGFPPIIYEYRENGESDPEAGDFGLFAVKGAADNDYLSKLASARKNEGSDSPMKERLGVVKDWLHDCDEKHDCGNHEVARSTSGFAPPRLLRIGTDARSVHLLNTTASNVSQCTRYATLSYCWGQQRPLMLTSGETSDRLYEGIATQELGRVFREVICLLWELDIEYVWIDSLCIIQNSPNNTDWLKHTPMMHLIYGRSYLNIAAAASRSWAESLWRDPEAAQFYPMKIILPDGMSLYSHGNTYPSGTYSDMALVDDYESSPLFGRGWCVQEFLFSTRTVYMADSQMFWQCPEERSAEILMPRQMDSWRPNWNNTGHFSSELDRLWLDIALQYATTQVTFPRDRLYALASAAKWFQQAYEKVGVKTRYLVGCWEHLMPETLLWRGDIWSGRYLELNLPSWSWMWADAGFVIEAQLRRSTSSGYDSVYSLPKNFFVDIKGMTVDLEDPTQPFGLVKAAIIQLEGPLLQIVNEEEDGHNGNERAYGRCYFPLSSGHSIISLSDHSVFTVHDVDGNEAKTSSCRVHVEVSSRRGKSMIEPENFVLMPIAYTNAGNGLLELIHAIALEHSETSSAGKDPSYKHRGIVIFRVLGPIHELTAWHLDPTAGDLSMSYNVVDDLGAFIKERPKTSIQLV